MEFESFFEKYYEKKEFKDRKMITNENPVDVIIPIFNTTPFFEENLISFYREIPINRLLIGDGGCTDNSIEIVNKFPRVKIIDQSAYLSLGFCIAELISNVQTEWFIYLHSDVFLPENWYDTMKKYQNKYDWYECDRLNIALIEYNPDTKDYERALSGSQMGRKSAFDNIISRIDDDYLYRNEDIIFSELIKAEGFKYGKIFDTYHFHQVMNKKGENQPKYKIIIRRSPNKQWDIRTFNMQVKGIIKYLKPRQYLIDNVNQSLRILLKHNALNIKEFKAWVKKTDKEWLKYIKIGEQVHYKIFQNFLRISKKIYGKIF